MIQTGIVNLDRILGGGIPKKSVVVITGSPGTYKTLLSSYIMLNNVKKNTGVYISLDQSRDDLLEHCRSAEILEENSDMNIIDFDDFLNETHIENFKDILKSLKTAIENEKKKNKNFRMVVIDSLNTLIALNGDDNVREFLFDMFQWLKSMNLLTILVSDIENSEYEEDLSFLSDGIIELKNRDTENSFETRVRVRKLRGTKHLTDYFAIDLYNGVFNIGMLR